MNAHADTSHDFIRAPAARHFTSAPLAFAYRLSQRITETQVVVVNGASGQRSVRIGSCAGPFGSEHNLPVDTLRHGLCGLA